MPQRAWSAKRARQYACTKDSLLERGKPTSLAEEIAAPTVNKERAQHGESVERARYRSTICLPAGVAACGHTSEQAGGRCGNFAVRPINAA